MLPTKKLQLPCFHASPESHQKMRRATPEAQRCGTLTACVTAECNRIFAAAIRAARIAAAARTAAAAAVVAVAAAAVASAAAAVEVSASIPQQQSGQDIVPQLVLHLCITAGTL